MKTNLLFSIVLLAFININVFAQDFEVIPTGPPINISTYVPHSSLKGLNGVISVTHYEQCWQTWSSDLYGIGSCNTICIKGCALTCEAMLLTANGIFIDPGQLNLWLQNHNGYAGCLADWQAITSGNYPNSTITCPVNNQAAFDLPFIKLEIDLGNPVIIHVAGSQPCSHFVLISGYNGTGTSMSDFLVYDSHDSIVPKYLSDFTICSATDDATPLRIFDNVSVQAIAGLNETIISQNIYIYPNPANDNITIENTPLSIIKDEIISVFNIQGQLLLQQPMLQTKTIIDISGFAGGMYYVKVKTEKGVVVKKFVKE